MDCKGEVSVWMEHRRPAAERGREREKESRHQYPRERKQSACRPSEAEKTAERMAADTEGIGSVEAV